MRQIQTIEDVYPAIEELIAELRLAGHSKLADVLHHRMHQVAWTVRSELLEELQSVLTEVLRSDGASLPERLRKQMQQLRLFTTDYLRNSEA